MYRTFRWIGLGALFLMATAAGAGPAQKEAPAQDVHFLDPHGQVERGVRCAAPPVGRVEAARVELALRRYKANKPPGKPQPTPTATPAPDDSPTVGPNGEIPVYFHVIYRSHKRFGDEGNVPLVQIETQIDVLNAAFRDRGFSFYLAGVDRTQNEQWFSGCYDSAELEMKQALAVDPAHVLNVYTCKPRNGILGYSYYPWSFAEDSVIHGAVVLYSSLPGGSAAPYNEGDTLTHEVGHYLGLSHTFQNGCQDPGDSVADTPAEASPAYGCPDGRDSCSADGLDPIYNFMDYTDDACMYEFTVNQATRMEGLVAIYRPSLR